MKSRLFFAGRRALWSLPSRGAWIEIKALQRGFDWQACRSPHGERGLKYDEYDGSKKYISRSPHGERGLKFRTGVALPLLHRSLPSRGAWIEIYWPER